jgi:hypothetical protein
MRQRQDYYREVNHIAIEGPVTQTKWSPTAITFTAQHVNLTSFPHTDAMVITAHIDQWDMVKILIHNGSQAEIPFLSTFEKMGHNKKQLKELMKPLYDLSGKRIKPIGVITLHVSFGTPKNHRTEYITFNIVDMLYPSYAIIRRGQLNTFETAMHSTYLCLKVPANFGAITVCGSQEELRNTEHGSPQGTRMYISLGNIQMSMSHGNLHLKKKPKQNSRTQPKPKMSAR